MQHTLVKSIVITGFIAFGVVSVVLGLRPSYVGSRKGKADENYIPSENCRTCHEGHYESWRRTFHSRMTQEAQPSSVQGDFSGNGKFEYLGVKVEPTRRGDRFFIKLSYPDGRVEDNEIARTVGSRRIEQYVTKRAGQYFRLPVAYDIERKRWMSLNGSFFYPDGDNFDQHLAQWDTNCVFCHNVKAQPNFNFQTRRADTEVAELGIACGACHGQGAEHAEQAASPWRRAMWHMGLSKDTRIVDPLKIDSDRAMMICGHCHGQRVPEPTDRIRDIMSKGDPFDAGEDLSKFYKPVDAHTTIGSLSFASRFWADGSPRLTAYEYQGILSSKCFIDGKPGNRINCLSCHTMHEGDIRGQITEEKRTNIACTQCHTQLADGPALSAHTKHLTGSTGSSCYSCHMPEVVSGVMSFHNTHKITVPDPVLTLEKNVPNACNQCHVDKSLNWTLAEVKRMWPDRYPNANVSADAMFDKPETVRGLFAGDALTRSMMADAILKHGERAWALALLAESFADDDYPIVRFFSANGLTALRGDIAKPDYLAHADIRSAQVGPWLDSIGQEKLAEIRETAQALRKIRVNSDVEVGE